MSHIQTHFDAQLESLTEKVLRQGGLAEQAIARAAQALVERDSDLAREVTEQDREINRLELEIDHLCLELLLLQTPKAGDLRFITTAMKINSDLERIGDHAVNIAERTLELNEQPPLSPFIDLPAMADRAQGMVSDALNAFVRRDADLALSTIERDRKLNQMMVSNFSRLVEYAQEQPDTFEQAVRMSFITKYLERIGDMAKNICEQVVFMVKGEVIKHPGSQAEPGSESGESGS